MSPRPPPKCARLQQLRAAGLPVPPLMHGGIDAEPPTPAALEALGPAPFIVRSALAREDDADASLAGLGLSIPGCADARAVAQAWRDVGKHASGLPQRSARDEIFVQPQIPGVELAVVLVGNGGVPYVERHDYDPGALGAGATPKYRGTADEAPGALRQLVDRTLAALESTAHGWDLECVLDGQGQWWLVQARPLAAELYPGFGAFAAEAGPLPAGSWTLDGEHNPAPLSAAHASLLPRIRERRRDAGNPTALAGWLYVETPVRDLNASAADPGPPPDPRSVLRELQDELLPLARSRLVELEAQLAQPSATRDALRGLLDRAVELFLAMIDTYLERLVPARRHAASRGPRHADPHHPHSLADRAAYLDVLPLAWDVAADPLAATGKVRDDPGVRKPTAVPDDPAAAASLLWEMDDHLFALGMAPVRAVYLRAAEILRIDRADVFRLTIDELSEALAAGRGPTEEQLESRRRRDARWARLRPPAALLDGGPTPLRPQHHFQGHGLGTPVGGIAWRVSDLRQLRTQRAPEDAILCIPALTAQAAWLLPDVSVRGVCTQYGGAASHAALMLREFGLAGILGCEGLDRLEDGEPIYLDTIRGYVRRGASWLPVDGAVPPVRD